MLEQGELTHTTEFFEKRWYDDDAILTATPKQRANGDGVSICEVYLIKVKQDTEV